MTTISKIEKIYPYLPHEISEIIKIISPCELRSISEIRLRRGKKITVNTGLKEYFVTRSGTLTNDFAKGAEVKDEYIVRIYQLALRNSVHSFHREIINGYITVDGGCRIGFCGTAVQSDSDMSLIENIKDISSVNIRIAREIIGCADELYRSLISCETTGLLLIGPPSCGKTTMIRDLTRQLGQTLTVSLIDERNEIACVYGGVPQNDVGAKTDVFSSYNRYDGIMIAVRVMSPRYIVVDEIGSNDDLKALGYALNSGVSIIAACHGAGISDVRKKSVIRKLIKAGAFGKYALIGTGIKCGTIVESGDINSREKEKAKC